MVFWLWGLLLALCRFLLRSSAISSCFRRLSRCACLTSLLIWNQMQHMRAWLHLVWHSSVVFWRCYYTSFRLTFTLQFSTFLLTERLCCVSSGFLLFSARLDVSFSCAFWPCLILWVSVLRCSTCFCEPVFACIPWQQLKLSSHALWGRASSPYVFLCCLGFCQRPLLQPVDDHLWIPWRGLASRLGSLSVASFCLPQLFWIAQPFFRSGLFSSHCSTQFCCRELCSGWQVCRLYPIWWFCSSQ